MYRRSPILRATLSPKSSGQSTPSAVSEKFEREVARIRMLSRLESARNPPVSDNTGFHPIECETPSLADEVQKTQSVITELIALFQDYRMSVEARFAKFISEIDDRIDRAVDQRFKELQSKRAFTETQQVDVNRLREELRYLKEDHARLTEKVKRINDLNCESHVKSSLALKTIRDLINR